MRKVLTAPEAARLLRVSYQSVCKAMRDGQIPAAKINGQWRILEEDLLEYLRGPFGRRSPAIRTEPSAVTKRGTPRQRRESLIPPRVGPRGPYKKRQRKEVTID